MEFLDSTKPHRKSGGSPTLAFTLAELSAVAPFRKSIGNQSSFPRYAGANLGTQRFAYEQTWTMALNTRSC
jgi:hypothetical protein